MILSSECFARDTCKKYQNLDKECECRNQDVFCARLFKLDQLYKLSLLTNRQRKRIQLRVDDSGADLDKFQHLGLVEEDIINFVARGDNLYLYSYGVGNGKTSWAVRLLQTYLNTIWYKCSISCHVLFVSVPRYLLALKDSISNVNEYASFINSNILTAELVVFDDIATKTATQFEHEHLFNIVDSRINDSKSNIFTSNVDFEGLCQSMGNRIASRVFNTSLVIELTGKDKRCLGGD